MELNKLSDPPYIKLRLMQLCRLISNDTIVIQSKEEVTLIHTADIIYCSGAINYTHIWLLNNQKIVVPKTLGEIEKQIENSSFFRIHQSFLINCLWLQHYKKGKGGYVTMIDGTKLDVSARKKEAFIQFIS